MKALGDEVRHRVREEVHDLFNVSAFAVVTASVCFFLKQVGFQTLGIIRDAARRHGYTYCEAPHLTELE